MVGSGVQRESVHYILEVDRFAGEHAVFDECDDGVCVPVEELKVGYTVAVEEGAGH